MSCNYYRITNYNNVQEGFYRWTGCTGGIISVTSVDPLQTSYVCATDVYVENYGAPLDVVNMGLCPSNTPTPSITPTVTPTSVTPTVTPTPSFTPTPTRTPVIIYMYNLRGGGYYQDVCESVNLFANPANVTIYTLKEFGDLKPGDNVYGNESLTIPPINPVETISNGATFIQISGTLVVNVGMCG